MSNTAPLGLSQIVSKLQKNYPKLYATLIVKRPETPIKLVTKLTREAQELCDGEEITIPVRRNTLLVQARLYWEEGDAPALEVLGFKPTPEASSRAQKNLVKLLWEITDDPYASDDFVERMREEVLKSKPCKAFTKRLVAYCEKLDVASATYDFDYERDIGISSEY